MDEIQELSEIYKALSDPTRLRLIKLLNDHQGVLCVNALAHKLGVTQSAVSQHLRVLRQADLVTANRHGASVHYSFNKDRLSVHNELARITLGESFSHMTEE